MIDYLGSSIYAVFDAETGRFLGRVRTEFLSQVLLVADLMAIPQVAKHYDWDEQQWDFIWYPNHPSGPAMHKIVGGQKLFELKALPIWWPAGLCPACGTSGKWIRTTLMCVEHGVILGGF